MVGIPIGYFRNVNEDTLLYWIGCCLAETFPEILVVDADYKNKAVTIRVGNKHYTITVKNRYLCVEPQSKENILKAVTLGNYIKEYLMELFDP